MGAVPLRRTTALFCKLPSSQEFRFIKENFIDKWFGIIEQRRCQEGGKQHSADCGISQRTV